MQINHYFLPGALLARAWTAGLPRRHDGAAAGDLERIGGFAALVDHLADDNVLGGWCSAWD